MHFAGCCHPLPGDRIVGIVTTGKGVYIRSLARDIGKKLGTGAYMSALTRTRVGKYSIDQALTPEQAIPHLVEQLNP